MARRRLGSIKTLKTRSIFRRFADWRRSPPCQTAFAAPIILADGWVSSGDCWVWNPEAHWNQGKGVACAVPGIVWALVETLD
ncbi:MAG TPA: hypothetical protein VEA44_00995 [Caulobacter sp.]|nr:hypothetical protein [Caulobacter sp.]